MHRRWNAATAIVSRLLVLVLASTVAAGCAAPGQPTAAAPAVSAPATGESWEQEWAATLAAARSEGEVFVYGTPQAAVRRLATEPFEQKYGIRVTYLGAGSDSTQRVLAERDSGIYAADFYFGGATNLYQQWLPAGILEPVESFMILPDVKDPQYWIEGFHYGDFDKRYIFLYNLEGNQPFYINTTLVGPDEITGYQDLLNPKWKGKIGMADPRSSGPGTGQWMLMLETKTLGDAFLRQFVAQDLFLTADRRTLTQRVARGALAVTLNGLDEETDELNKAGLPIQRLRRFAREGTTMTAAGGAVAVFKNAPHPNAARVYLNWFLSRETMEILCEAQGQACLRNDIQRSPLAAAGALDRLLAEGVPYIDNYSEAVAEPTRRARAHALSVLGS